MFYQGNNYVENISASACDTNNYPTLATFGQRRAYGFGGIHYTNDTAEMFTLCDSIFPYTLGRTMTMMSDSSGNLLFHSNGLQLIDRSGQTMLNGDSLTPLPYRDLYPLAYGPLNTMLTLPYPGRVNQYIVLHQGHERYYQPPSVDSLPVTRYIYYSVVDMNLNGGLGAVTQKNVQVLVPADSMAVGNFTACRHANGRDWWVIQPGFRDSMYYILRIDSSGVFFSHSQVFETPGLYSYREGAGQASFTPDAELYARYIATIGVKLYKFDRCSGSLSGELLIDGIPPELMLNSGIGGVAFSPSGKFMYVTNSNKLFQYDISKLDTTLIQASKYTVATRNADAYVHPIYGNFPVWTGGFSWLQPTPDGKIVIGTGTSNLYLYQVGEPDSLGSACAYQRLGVFLPVWTGLALPLYPHYRLGALTGSACDTLGLSSLQSTSYWLDFGQVEAGSSATLGIDVVSWVGYPASLDTLQYRQATGVFSSSLALPAMLPKYDTLQYEVTFSPTSAGYVEDTLELHSNYGVVRVRLTGNGISSVGTVASQPVSVQLYPNPASNTVTVYAQGAEIAQALLYSSRGELLKTQSIALSKGQLDLAGLPPGLYLVELVLADGRRGISKLLVINY
jgi:hypothetical protein